MSTGDGPVLLLRFGVYELDLKNSELRRAGILVRITPQQFRVLRWLAEHAGDVCTRDEIQREIWGGEVFVDFDRSLTVCIGQIRAVLNDDSESPRYIQTVPRRGYRFVAPVTQVRAATAATADSPTPVAPIHRRPSLPVLGICLLGLGTLAALVWARALPARRTVIAVLPFANSTLRDEDLPMIDGLQDELIGQFGSLQPERLGVIGRTSTVRYRDGHAGLPQIGRELGVDYVVEGDVRSDGARLRISARLVQVDGQAQVWGETYEREATVRFELQEEVAARVSAGVIRTLFPAAVLSAVRAHVPAREAAEALTNGRYLEHKNNFADAARAITWYQEAARLDAGYAEAWAALAGAQVGRALSGAGNAAEALEAARLAATKAVSLDDRNAEAHNALGEVLFWRDWNWSEAETRFRHALAINPSYAQAHHDYAFLLVATGHPEAAVTSLRRAIALEPLSPRVNADAGWVLLHAHHFEEAIAQAKRALQLEPGLGEASACIARAERLPEVYRAILARGARTSFFNQAIGHAGLGRNEEALQALQSSYNARETMMPLINTEPAFAGLRGDPRFRQMVSRMRLPE